MNLRGEIAVIAGCGAMGGSIARHLASEGACVALLDKDAGTVESVGQSLRPYEVKTLGMTVDLVNSEQVDDAFENVRATLGTPTILVNVLGGIVRFAEHKPLYNWTDAEWELVRSVNLDYVFKTCRAALTYMVEARKGSIVNISSVSGMLTPPGQSPYAAAKSAVISLTRTMALECGRYGIRVNSVAPGNIDNRPPVVTESFAPQVELLRSTAGIIPLGRFGTLEDISRAVLYLVSPEASYVTGHTLTVDGGMMLRHPLPLPGSHPTEAP